MSRRRRLSALAAAALALLQLVLMARTAWDKSDTSDEPVYIGAAALLWTHRDYSYNNPAPVLPKWAYAVALRLVDGQALAAAPPEWSTVISHMLWVRRTERLRLDLFAARCTTILAVVAGGLLLWAAGRRFGDGVALLTHALWCVSPSILANGSLATLDGWLAATMCLVLWTGVRLFERPSWPRVAAAGAALGLALGCKVTALGIVPVVLAVAFVALRRQAPASRLPWRAARVAALYAGAAALALWALYGFTVGEVSTELLAQRSGTEARRFGPLPFPAWISGLLHQWELGAAGHRTYLFGRVETRGWWWFYLAALAFKTTIGAQALALARLASWVRRPPTRGALLVDAALLAYPLALFVLMSQAATQTGIRYLLPAFPFVMLFLGRALPDLWRAFGRAGAPLAAACALAAAIESLAVHPHHLMFFNRWAGGPVGGPRYLILSDDWGQDQRRLGEWIKEHRLPGVFYTYYAGMPRKWGVEYRPPPCTPRRGTYALHAVEVHRPRRIPPGCLDWLTVEPPDERIGYSIYIYQVNRERLDRLVAARGTPHPFWRSGAPPAGEGATP